MPPPRRNSRKRVALIGAAVVVVAGAVGAGFAIGHSGGSSTSLRGDRVVMQAGREGAMPFGNLPGQSDGNQQVPDGQTQPDQGQQGQDQQGWGLRSRGMNEGLAGALHGDFVVGDGNGGTVTKRLQTGTVTSVSSTSLAVKSSDGYTSTYAIDQRSTSIPSVSKGDTVRVIATVKGDAATITSLQLSSGTRRGGSSDSSGSAGPSDGVGRTDS